MTVLPEISEMSELNAVARAATSLGYEKDDIAGCLDLVEIQARDQRAALSALENGAPKIEQANAAVQGAATDLGESVARTAQDVALSAKALRDLGTQSRHVAEWVQQISARSCEVNETLKDIKSNSTQLASISMHVNTLAINAKIEAARAGESGLGFAGAGRRDQRTVRKD